MKSLTRSAALVSVAVLTAGSAHADVISVEFNLNLPASNTSADTLVQQSGAAFGTLTDSATGQSIGVRGGYYTAANLGSTEQFGDFGGEPVEIVLAATASNGSGVDVGTAGSSQRNQIQSDQQPGIFNEFIEFEFTSETELISMSLTSLGDDENVLVEYGTVALTLTNGDTNFASDVYSFPGNPVLQAGDTLRLTTLAKTGGGRTDIRFTELNVEVVPEPGSMLLIGLGALALAARRRS